MTRSIGLATTAAFLMACGGGGDGGVEATSRDSAGVAIMEYPASALAAAPVWQLSQEPLAVIGADEGDESIDLSTSMLGALFPDGRMVVVTAQPSEVLWFNADGTRGGMIGRPGSGPGEYRFVMQLLRFGGDSVFVFDAGSRKGIIFPAPGAPMGSAVDFPVPADRPFPPLIRGRLADGTFIHSGESIIPTPPAGASGYFRLPMPMFAFRPGQAAYDTLFTTAGPQSYASTVQLGDSTIALSRQVTFGPSTQIAVGPDVIWHSLADAYAIERREPDGRVSAIIRVAQAPRPVLPEHKERFKVVLREALERMKSLMPPSTLQSELARIDQTVFAENFAALGQLAVDETGALWVTASSAITDTITTWTVFDRDGRIVGSVVLPEGQLLGATATRVAVRREDEETGVVRVEIWGLTRQGASN